MNKQFEKTFLQRENTNGQLAIFVRKIQERYTNANKRMKRHSTSLVIREMQIKTTVRYDFTPTRMTIIKKMENNKC